MHRIVVLKRKNKFIFKEKNFPFAVLPFLPVFLPFLPFCRFTGKTVLPFLPFCRLPVFKNKTAANPGRHIRRIE